MGNVQAGDMNLSELIRNMIGMNDIVALGTRDDIEDID
ncbi:unknown [Hungatella hathewayi CAG:224]|nr:unknown [Hungatella hathewayi CAG:224]